MRYSSTRCATQPASFSEILLEGLASDGGLYVPEAFPRFSPDDLKSFSGLAYCQLAAVVLGRFAPEIPADVWERLAKRAYDPSIFKHARPDSDRDRVFPLRALGDGLSLLELSNGPTLAFKDAAMQLLGQLLSWALAQQKRTLTILGATSGDTGSAAIHALRSKTGVKVVMLSPAGRMSAFQRAQMYSVLDQNILNVAVSGTFDECQDLVKTVNNDAAFKKDFRLGAVNSINWARLAAQSVYYIFAYLQSGSKIGEPVSFVVPSGNFGNAYAGLVAKFMGLPIERIIVATNENDVLAEALSSGLYAPRTNAVPTSSPSMDITKASNFERALFDAAAHDPRESAALWADLATQGRIDLKKDHPAVWRRLNAMGLEATSSLHANRLETIRAAQKRWDILIDPHTADGLFAALKLRRPGERMIVLETARAEKFAPLLLEATGVAPSPPKEMETLLSLPQRVTPIPVDAEALKSLIRNFGGTP